MSAGDNNREGGNDIDSIVNSSVAASAFLSKANTIDKLINIRTRSYGNIVEDRLVGLTVGKDFSIAGPNISTNFTCVDIGFEFILEAIANSIFGGSLCN